MASKTCSYDLKENTNYKPHNVVVYGSKSDLPSVAAELFFFLHNFTEVCWLVRVDEPGLKCIISLAQRSKVKNISGDRG